jgi:hypothetical protein
MKTYKPIWVSFFDNVRETVPSYSICLYELFDFIKSQKWREEIQLCRTDLANKMLLPCFTSSGIFNLRNKNSLTKYSKVICLDIDKIDDVSALKEKCKEIPWILAAYTSPSGKGLKVFVRASENARFQGKRPRKTSIYKL